MWLCIKKCENDKVISVEKKEGVSLRDVWEILCLNPKAQERVGCPIQIFHSCDEL